MTLPGGQTVTSGEEVIQNSKFSSSIPTFYIKSHFASTNKRFIAHYPNIALGILPLGFNNLTFNLKQISGVNIDISYKILRIIIGIILVLVGIGSLSDGIGVLLLLLGLLLIFSAVQVFITISSSGGVTKCPIVFWEKSKAQLLINELNGIIAENN